MTKAVLTSACGDPFILMLCMKMFQERFYDEVDHYYVNVNNHVGVPKEVISELLSRLALDPKIHIIYHSRGRGNGPPVTEMVHVAKEELFVLLEDDHYIFQSGHVSRCFQQIESDLVDVVGSPRGSCGVEITEASVKKYGIDMTGYGDVGVNFWPSAFFVKRKDLMRTDLDFGSHTWVPGEYSKELDHTFRTINHGDTAVWMCVQLRALGLRFGTVPQFHASPTETVDKQNDSMNWYKGQKPYWIHGGSLSTSWGGYLSGSIPDVSTDMAKWEIETRVSFWKIASDVIEGFTDFKVQYRAGIENLIEKADLNRDRIEDKYKLYRSMLQV